MKIERLLDGIKAIVFIVMIFVLPHSCLEELERNEYPVEVENASSE